MKKLSFYFLTIIVLSILKSNRLYAQIKDRDSMALVALYNAMDGAHWTNNMNWLTSAKVNTWYGIKASHGRVKKIKLKANNLKGTFPYSLSQLDSLETLDLSENNIEGGISGIPDNLVNLALNSNKLTGQLPSFTSLLKLETLNLSNNNFSGELPSRFASSKIREVYLNNNNLTGRLPILWPYFYIKILDLSFNNFKGRIPYQLSNGRYTYLNLKHNRFTFAGMVNLEFEYPDATLKYGGQANIHVNKNGNILSAYTGGAHQLEHDTFKWYKDGILVATIIADSEFVAIEDGAYNVVVRNSVAKKLTLYSDTINYVSSLNSIATKLSNSLISVYPNPAKANATLSFHATGKYMIMVTNLSGKTLQTKTGVSNKSRNIIQLDVSKYASGMYLITIIDEKQKRQTLRLNKE